MRVDSNALQSCLMAPAVVGSARPVDSSAICTTVTPVVGPVQKASMGCSVGIRFTLHDMFGSRNRKIEMVSVGINL